MKINIKFKDKTEIIIFNVFDIEQCYDVLVLKQVDRHFMYDIRRFKIDKIDKVVIDV